MERQKKVIVIEDMPDARKNYTEVISLAGYTVDTAVSYKEAIERINNKTYHVAVVDITLDVEDYYNRDGLKIIDFLYQLDEGTEAIILSAQHDLEVAVEAFEKYKLSRYLEKRKLKNLSDLSSAVDEAYTKCSIKEYGRWGALLNYLAGKDNAIFWTDKSSRILKPMDGWAGLNVFFSGVCQPFTPLLHKMNREESPTIVDESDNCVYGEFWSKGIGGPVSLFAYQAKIGYELLEKGKTEKWDIKNLRYKYEKANILGLVFDLPQAVRHDFIAKLI